jgi:WD40 repeat protein
LAVAVGQRGGRPVVVSGGDDGTVRVWDLASGEVIATIAFPDSVSAVAAAPEGWLGAGFGWEVAVLRPTGEPRRATGPGDGNAPPEPPDASAGGLR